MKLQLTVEIDGTEAYQEQQLSELETVVEGNEEIRVFTAHNSMTLALLAVTEVSA